jgi:hypothetical protein
MEFSIKRLAIIAASAILLAGVPAFGQSCPTAGDVCVSFTGGYTTTWGNLGGDYGAGIYSGTVNGAALSPGMICDDFSDEITTGESWSAKAIQVSTLANGNVSSLLFGGSYSGYTNIGVTGYAEVATLASMMFSGTSSFGGITGITQAELSSAIWDITQGGTLQGLDTKATSLVTALEAAFSGNASAAEKYLASLTNLWILTPDPTGVKGEPQEMFIMAAEGGAALMYLLLAAFFCSGAFFKRTRERHSA